MKARAEICVELDRTGHSRVWLQSQAPLVLRRTGLRTGRPSVHLLGGAGGPLGGDELSLRVRLGPGAALTLRSVAAMIAQPDAQRRTSTAAVDIELAEGADLDGALEPLVMTRSARHMQSTSLKLTSGATALWREVTVLGRHDEESGSVQQRLAVELAEADVLVQTQSFGPDAPRGWSGPAGLAGARVVGSLLGVGGDLPYAVATTTSATMSVRDGVWLRTALGADVRMVDRALSPGPVGVRQSA